MSDKDTQYGFIWGPLEVTRMAHFRMGEKSEAYCVRVRTEAGKSIDVYVSRTGRSLRVFRDGEELK
jgi:hypothetical protein